MQQREDLCQQRDMNGVFHLLQLPGLIIIVLRWCFTMESVTPSNQYILDRGHAPVVMEKQFHFDEELMQLCPNDVSLYGFFQTEKYFAHIRDEIRRTLLSMMI